MISRRDKDPVAQVLEMLLDSQESAGGHGIIRYLPKVSVLAVTDSPIVVCGSALTSSAMLPAYLPSLWCTYLYELWDIFEQLRHGIYDYQKGE